MNLGRNVVRHLNNKKGKLYDVVVIGGGHNGLTAAAYLQKSGFEVCVLEARPVVGGAAVTEEIIPNFKFSRASYVLSLLRPQIYHDLKLKEFGLNVLPRDPSSYTPLRDDLWTKNARSLTLSSDAIANEKEIAKFSTNDAVAFEKYEKLLARVAYVLEPLLDASPHASTKLLSGNILSRCRALLSNTDVRKAAGRLMELGSDSLSLYEFLTAPPLKILKRWFESEVLITTLAADAVIGTVSTDTSGTGYVLLLHAILGECEGRRGGWGYPVGGMGSVSNAIAASATAMGVDIITNEKVDEILLDGSGEARAVRTSSGLEVCGRLILSNATPQVTFLELLPQGTLPPHIISDLKSIDYSSGVTKINVAVNKLPSFKADPNGLNGESLPHHQTTIHINSERLSCLDDAYKDYAAGRYSARPLVEMTIPSVLDKTIAPDGCHVCLLFTQYTPYELATGPWTTDKKEEYGKAVLNLVDEYAPGFSDSVIGMEILTPPDLENIFGLTGGNIFHGAMSIDRLFMLRPTNYATSECASPFTAVPRLLLCGSGAHPGGGVSGAPGRIAALESIKFLKGKKL